MVEPNLQTIPRGHGSDDEAEVQRWVKETFVAPVGSLFWSRDFSAIEAILVGYFAGSARYIKAAKLGIHAYLCSHVLRQPTDLSWTDDRIQSYHKELKGANPVLYDTCKRICHGSNYAMTPQKMRDEYPETFPTIKDARELQGMYFELFPEIKTWHKDLCTRVDGTKRKEGEQGEEVNPWTLGVCWVQNPFGYIHRFYNTLDWERIEIEEGEFRWVKSLGEDAKRLISFLPQSTAAAIIKKSGKALWYDYPTVGYTMRLWIHDEILGEAGWDLIDQCLATSKTVMEAPIEELPLDPRWGMGEHLTIPTEGKVGHTWADMKGA